MGDVLVLFSDGLVEAVNRRDDDFGEARLVSVAHRHQDRPARVIRDAILAAVRAFGDGQPARDDQTLLVVRLWAASSATTPETSDAAAHRPLLWT